MFPLAVNEVSPDEAPALLALRVAGAVVHAELVKRVLGIGMVRVEQQLPVCQPWVEDTVLVQAGAVELGEVVLREQLPAVRTANFPGPPESVELPGIHRHV